MKKEDILKCKNKSDVCRLLNIPTNGRGMKIVNNLLEEYDLTTDIFIKKKVCKNCKKQIPNSNTFCSKSCSASFNNKKRIITDEHKKKTSESVKEWFKKNGNNNSINFIGKKINCLRCDKEFEVERLDSRRLSRKKYCSEECAYLSMKENVSKKQKEKVKNGTHKGWQSRNILSYPEKFFIKVLKRNKIFNFCEPNYTIKKRDLGLDNDSNYFLDFYFKDKKIDLEIDGKQHEYDDRIESDKIRDEILIKNGILVFRIKWKDIKNKEGKNYIKNEINKFLKFYLQQYING